MQNESDALLGLSRWFRQTARPFLEKVQPAKLAELDHDLEKLLDFQKALPNELTVCFLGNSGVGKSTLINSLVSGSTILLPSGGIGPLTAQALTVRYGQDPRFEVKYHPFQSLWRLIFALEKSHQSELSAIEPLSVESEFERSVILDEDEILTDLEEDTGNAAVNRSAYRKIAQLLITGGQENTTEIAYLADSLREALGKPRKWGTTANDDDEQRVTAIRQSIELAKSGEVKVYRGSTQDRSFLSDLRNHGSGFLAPLIKDLTVFWDSPLLASGVALVDLPGVGISGDVYREITRKWIREKAEAVVLVVDHRGITEAVAELLRKSEFLNRLVYSAEDPASDPVLMVAVVKIDDIAESNYAEDRTRRKREHFADVCTKIISTIREQVRHQLEAVWSSDGQGLGETQKQVLNNILTTLQVHPLSAIQYRKALAKDEDDLPFLTDPGQSQVPRFQDSLGDLAEMRRFEHGERLRELQTVFVDRLHNLLEVTRAQWEEETRATEEAERLREELAVFMEPLRKEFHVRQGQYRGFLRNGVTQRIKDLVEVAKGKAQTEIRKYLNQLGHTHWATLRASVRRGGRFAGATDVDIPREFALRFEEPIAEAWSKQILKDIRTETKQYAADCVRLVEQVVLWAKDQGARVKPRLVEAQYKAIKGDATKLEAVGREMVNELRDEVKNRLIEEIDKPIRQRCQAFVRRNQDVGTGVKSRILELFSDMAEEVTTAAAKPATTILTNLFQDVEKEVSATFENHQDPLAAASEAIVSSQENYLKRSDAQKKRKVLEELRQVMSACPMALISKGGSCEETVS